MKEYGTESIRNLALVSHGGAGKTSLGEAMLHAVGAINRMGRVEEGNTVSDFEEEEIRRTQSLSTSLLPVEFKDHKLNVLDTPGFTDFVGEAISALSVADGAIMLVDSVAGVEVGTEVLWTHCERFGLPRVVVISKMDRENASFKRAIESVQTLPQMPPSSRPNCLGARKIASKASSTCFTCRSAKRTAWPQSRSPRS